MRISAILAKTAFDLGSLFGGQEDKGWTSASPDVGLPKAKTKQETPGVTYVQQSPGQTPMERAKEQQNPMMHMLMMQMLGGMGGQNQGPTISLGGQQQDPLQQFLMMHLLGKGMGKGAALSGDISSIAGRHSGDYAKNIMKQLTPEHFQAAEGAGGEDTIESLVRDVIPRELIARHAMQIGGGDVDLGKSILDSHLKQNPMHTGENLEGVLRRMLKANIAQTQDAPLKKMLSNLGDFSSTQAPKRMGREDLMKIIMSAGGQNNAPDSSGQGLAPALPEPGLSPGIGYPKTGRFENMQPVLDEMVKEAIPAPLGKAVEWMRGGPAVDTGTVRNTMNVNTFATPEGGDFQFDPDTFKSVLMRDPSVQRMARGVGPDVMNQMGRALKPGMLGDLSRGWQKHVMGRGSHIDAAQQALRNLASATGYKGDDPSALSQHFQTMTGTPANRVGDFLARNLMGSTKPSQGGQASNLFGIPGIGGMEINDPMHQMIQQLVAIRSMTGQQQQQPMGAA